MWILYITLQLPYHMMSTFSSNNKNKPYLQFCLTKGSLILKAPFLKIAGWILLSVDSLVFVKYNGHIIPVYKAMKVKNF